MRQRQERAKNNRRYFPAISRRFSIRKLICKRYARPRLLIVGGIAPAEVVRQETFEQQYGIQYHSYGCISPSSAGTRAYNQWVFQYLDATYGRQWGKTVRADVMGLEKKWYQGRR